MILADKDILLHDAQMARLFVQHLQTIIPAQKHKSLPKWVQYFAKILIIPHKISKYFEKFAKW